MIERFNGRIDDMSKTTRFRLSGDLSKTPLTCVGISIDYSLLTIYY